MNLPAVADVSHLRPLNLRRDLLEVADLIEICFASTLDLEGREFLRHLRAIAGDARYLSWMQAAADRLLGQAPLYGFVWEEDDRIVGNLSLFPLLRGGRVMYWIANVAVHPDYRRRGIARRLTRHALDYLRNRDVKTAWLQVRDDNPVAYHLYLSLGFVERYRRTTWQADSQALPGRLYAEGLTVGPRRGKDWCQQAGWLKSLYPPEVAWNLSLDYSLLGPGVWPELMRWVRGREQEDWAAYSGGRLLAAVTWQPTSPLVDPLWLALPVAPADGAAKSGTAESGPVKSGAAKGSPDGLEEKAMVALLIKARESLAYRGRPVQVNYPAGQAIEAFRRAGFSAHQTLIWMSISIPKKEF